MIFHHHFLKFSAICNLQWDVFISYWDCSFQTIEKEDVETVFPDKWFFFVREIYIYIIYIKKLKNLNDWKLFTLFKLLKKCTKKIMRWWKTLLFNHSTGFSSSIFLTISSKVKKNQKYWKLQKSKLTLIKVNHIQMIFTLKFHYM